MGRVFVTSIHLVTLCGACVCRPPIDLYVPPEIGTLDIHGKPRLKVQWCFIWALEDDYLDFRIFFSDLGTS